MSRSEARAEVLDLYSATKKLLGGTWTVGADDWLGCTAPSGAPGQTFGFLSQRLEQPLSTSLKVQTEALRRLWATQGIEATVFVDGPPDDPDYILSYPSFGTGVSASGLGIQLAVSENAVTFNASGRCVPVEDGQT